MVERYYELAKKLQDKFGLHNTKVVFVENPDKFKQAQAENEMVCYYDPLLKTLFCKHKGALLFVREKDL